MATVGLSTKIDGARLIRVALPPLSLIARVCLSKGLAALLVIFGVLGVPAAVPEKVLFVMFPI